MIAVLTDIHGNSIALDAALADARTFDVDRFWLLGDLSRWDPIRSGLQNESAPWRPK